MRRLRGLMLRFAGLFGRERAEREFAEEMESHLRLHIEDNLRRGMTQAEARRRALIDLGGVEQAAERHREGSSVPALERLMLDARHAARVLRKNPGFTAVVVLILGLGIGANTTIFSLVSAVLLRPLPYEGPDRIVQLWHTPPPDQFPGMTRFAISPANYLDWRGQNHVFEGMAAYDSETFSYSAGDRPEAVTAGLVTPDLFAVLRARPLFGRIFAKDEDRPGKDKVAVLDHRFWRTHFGSDRQVVGREIRLSGETYTIVGVMPAGFRFPGWADLWAPLAWSDQERQVRGEHNYRAIARLKEGVNVKQAQSEMSALSRRLEQDYPEDDKGWGALVVPLRDEIVGDAKPALIVLFVAVSLVLLIACANVASLVLARTLARRREMALRAALGASRGRILQQVLTENVLLALAGGLLGLGLACYGLDAIVALLGDRLPRAPEVGVDGRALSFTLLVSVLTGVAAGFLPGLRLTRVEPGEALKQGSGRMTTDTGGQRTRSALVIVEVAVSLVLLVGAGLMIRTLGNLRGVDPGFDPRGVVSMSVAIPVRKYPSPREQSDFYERALERVRRLPGIDAAGAVSTLPLSGGGSMQPVAIEGRPAVALSQQPEVAVRVMTPGYLQAMRIPLVRGRDFGDADGAGRPAVVLISESLARLFWPGEDPIGRHMTLTFHPGVAREVVGVVGDVKQEGLAAVQPAPTVYAPLAQMPGPWMTLVVRPKTPLASLVPEVTGAVLQVDPEQPVTDVLTLEALTDDSLAHQRATMLLLAIFAAFALLLAGMGIYGVLTYAVRKRVPEIGIRLALGARRSDVLWMVLGHGLRITLAGLLLGALGAIALTRLLAGLLFGVTPADPATFACVSVLLCAISLLASYLPARVATRVDPAVALRSE
jgi:putative ABC transport system permease protein